MGILLYGQSRFYWNITLITNSQNGRLEAFSANAVRHSDVGKLAALPSGCVKTPKREIMPRNLTIYAHESRLVWIRELEK